VPAMAIFIAVIRLKCKEAAINVYPLLHEQTSLTHPNFTKSICQQYDSIVNISNHHLNLQDGRHLPLHAASINAFHFYILQIRLPPATSHRHQTFIMRSYIGELNKVRSPEIVVTVTAIFKSGFQHQILLMQ
jgi:hypothetical protein